MRFSQTAMPGLVEIVADPRKDSRGRLVKTYIGEAYTQAGLPATFEEEFYSFSNASVLRGMHFQLPPHAQGKTVFCEHGAILDVVLDLRVGSPTYHDALAFELSAENGCGLYMPPGLAHGFCVVGREALVAYRTTTAYAPESEAGVRWDSLNVKWPVSDPVVSSRDAAFPRLDEFESPFRFEES